MPQMIAILFSLLTLTLMPAATSAQDSPQGRRDSIRALLAQYDEQTRLTKLREAIDTISSMESGKDISYSFLDLALDCNLPRHLIFAYMYAGYFASNNGEIDEGLALSFKGLEVADSLLSTPSPDSVFLLKNKSTLLMNISSFLSSANDFDGSFEYIQQAQEVAELIEDYENLKDIYYNIAIAYIEQELYESAIIYFQKDIEASLKAGSTNTSEQELTIQSLYIKNALKIHDTITALQLIDQCNSIKDKIPNICDANGISNYCISLISSNIEAINLDPKHRKQYLDECNQYLHILRNAIDSTDATLLEKLAYNPYYASYLAVSGNTDKAWQLLRDTSNFIGMESYETALYDYYKARNDYAKAYQLFWNLYSNHFKKHSLETAIHYEKSESRVNYEKRIHALQSKAQHREQDFEAQTKINSIIRIGSIVLLTIGLAIILTALYYLRLRNRLNEQLRRSNNDLMLANEELNMQREEILSQTNEIQHQSEIIKAQRDDLGSTNQQLITSISMARDIQTAVMVSSDKLRESVGDNFIYWQPLNIVSGDFYWCSKIGKQSYLAVADCTGHGVPGALLSMYGISMLNDIVWRNAHKSAAEILESLKAAFVRSFVFDEEQYFLDGIDVALVIINRDTMTIDYAGAKRPLIVVRDGTLYEYKPDKISIGHNPMRKNETFNDHKIAIQNGDMVYAFSDGISDQFGYEDGITKFGSRQLQNILTEMSFFDLPAQKKIIESSVDNWRIGAFLAGLTDIKAPQLDDQLLIGIRI